jgi:hypothetical protein
MATSPSGKARVCKTLIMGSNPIVASKNIISENQSRVLMVSLARLARAGAGKSHRHLRLINKDKSQTRALYGFLA